MKSDVEIAQQAEMKPIIQVAAELGLTEDELELYGKYKAKVSLTAWERLKDRPSGKIVLVSAINPTPAGEGKTTNTVGIGDALRRLGKKVVIALREPSLGPCFGVKGGAAGGGYAQVVPMEDINLHFTGDIHAVTTAHNLLAAIIDNHLHHGNELNIDPRRITWRRAMDLNERALRNIVLGLGGKANGVPREGGFDITVASEMMAILCLASDLDDMKERISRIIVAYTISGKPVTVADLNVAGALTLLFKDAIKPNLVQTLENTPAFVHGGPFANIAHGCSSVAATRAALALADFVVTEAGFGADLGAEKFLDIKCRQAGLAPAAAVVVATVRALKMHGGAAKSALDIPDTEALAAGMANLGRHVENLRRFGLPVVVAVNRFASDSAEEIALLAGICRDEFGVEAVLCTHFADGGAGAADLAEVVAAMVAEAPPVLHPLYPDAMPLLDKIETVARTIYGAAGIAAEAPVRARLAAWEAAGFGHLPVCIAKTQYSFSVDPSRLGAPTGHVVPVREVRLSAGAGFVVALCGDITTMPGLPRRPAAERISLAADGTILGLS